MNPLALFMGIFFGVAWPLWTWMRDMVFSLPRVDLGYEIHEALLYNKTTERFTFRNIRYAQAPIGDLRYAPPVAPTGRNPLVQRGNESRICPQGLLGDSINGWYNVHTPGTTEDCLFLDVVVPRSIFDRRGSCLAGVAFHYVMSDNQTGAIIDKESHFRDGFDGSVYVSANYRLGSLSQLAPSHSKELGSNSTDLGELDRELALGWVRENIHLFGGDGKKVYTYH